MHQPNHSQELESINLKMVIKITIQTLKAVDFFKKIQKVKLKKIQYGEQILTVMDHKTTSMKQIDVFINISLKKSQTGQ